MRLVLACSLLVALLAACQRPAPRAAAPTAAVCPPAPAGVSPLGYADERRVVYDADNMSIDVRDPTTGALTRVAEGTATLVPVPGLGTLIRTGDGETRDRLWDVDPDRPALRLLWRSVAEYETVDVAGVLDGAPALVIRSYAPEPAPPRLVCLRGLGAITELPLALPDDRQVASNDAIRGHRLLLHGRTMPELPEKPFTVPVEILDLDTATHRRLGDATGAWTIATAIPHAYVDVRWADHDPRSPSSAWGEQLARTHVDVADETLR